MRRLASPATAAAVFLVMAGCASTAAVDLPKRGVMAHRGASLTHPENTLAAIREAVRLGAQAVEIDVRRTADGELVLMHDATVDRTTDGTGVVADLAAVKIRALDAGAWRGAEFAGERVPTLAEALATVPAGVLVNVDLKTEADAELGRLAMAEVLRQGKQNQAFVWVKSPAQRDAVLGESSAAGVKVLVNNMVGQSIATNWAYANATIEGGHAALQFASFSPPAEVLRPPAALEEKLERADVRVFYYASSLLGKIDGDADKAAALLGLYRAGVDFLLVDDVAGALRVQRGE